ncbi:phage tail tape measure protein [Marinobacterium lutimaris]|uniref:Phage tail tape measure protein, TP901 family, core region n=1 Tax=Marinobacterium lutimaris TaxID=568106 RepID=A0A1H5XK80_9GAMM|nr:phage tail tape measure protein [Marinobacterium lutimaris]SEG12171.1 phage tail tape measure protein, TP901 family, core region [Marinobacterium lutimaris]
MASNGKNDDIVKLIIQGEDEYSSVSEEVRQELVELSGQAEETQQAFTEMQRALDLSETYREQEAEVQRLSELQARARQEVDRLAKANKEANGENLKTATSLAKARAEMASFRTATNRAQKEFDKTAGSLRSMGLSIKDVDEQQSLMQRSSERMAAELEEVRKKQDSLVSSGKEQADAARDQAKAQADYNEEIRKQGDMLTQQYRAYTRQREEQARVTAETEKLTTEIRDQIGQLERGEISWQDYQRRVRDAGTSADLTRKQVADISRSMEEQVVSARRSNQALREQEAETKRVEKATERYSLALKKLVEDYRQGNIDSERFEQSTEELRQKFDLTEDQVRKTRQEMSAYVTQIERAPGVTDRANKSTDSLAKMTRRLAQAYAVLLSAQRSAQAVAGGYGAYVEQENAMLGLQKTTELAGFEINGLADEMRRLSRDVTPTTAAELLNVAESAGRMGIQGAENIREFTTSIDALSSATDLAGDETAEAIAQILNVTGEAQSNVRGVSSAIAELGNTSATTEEQIVHFAKRLASDTASVNLTSAEVLGLSAAMAEMGLQAEGTGTVIGRTFRYIADAVQGGGAPMEQLQRITGKTAEEIENAFGEDKVQLFADFVAGMGRMQDGGATLNQILSDLGIKSDENARILGLLTQRHEGLTAAVDRSNAAFDQGNAHFEEMAKKAASLESGFTRLANRARTLQAAMGEAFADDLSRKLDELNDGTDNLEEGIAELGELVADLVLQLADFIGTINGIGKSLGALLGDVSLFDGLLTGLSMTIDRVSAYVDLLVGGFAQLGIAWNEFFGDTEDVEKWRKIQEDAFDRIESKVKRYNDNLDRLNGESSRAFQDLRDTYNENRDALDRMDAAQRQAAETIINTTGYLEGNDAAYRDLTRAIQRAAGEKRILKDLTDEENALLNNHIAMLKAQGVEEEEAIRRAKEYATERKRTAEQEAQSDTVRIKVTQEVRQELDYLSESLERKASTAESSASRSAQAAESEAGAVSKISDSLNEATGSVNDFETQAIASFQAFADRGVYSSNQVLQAFSSTLDGIQSNDAVDQLTDSLRQLGAQGVLSSNEMDAALELVDTRLKEINEGVGAAWKALKLDVDAVTGSLTEQGRVATESFRVLVESGRYTSDQLKQAFDAALSQTTTRADVEALIAVLQKAAEEGRLTGEALQQAFDLATGKAREAATEIDEAFSALGLNMEEVTNQVTEGSKKATEAFVDIARSGEYSGAVIQQAFDAALSRTRTQADAELLKQTLKELGSEGTLSGKALTDAYQGADSQIKKLKTELDNTRGAARGATDEIEDLNREIEKTEKVGTGSIGELIKEIRKLVEEVGKLADGFKEAGDEAERMKERANRNSSNSDDDDNEVINRPMRDQVADRLRAQGRGDAADLLLQNIAAGDVPSNTGIGIDGWNRWWDQAQQQALKQADAVQGKYDELARYQRDIAAGDVKAAEALLAQRNRFADLEADLVGIVTQASNLVNSNQGPLQQPGQQVQAPASNEVVVKFDISGRQYPGRFEPSVASSLLDELEGLASVSR